MPLLDFLRHPARRATSVQQPPAVVQRKMYLYPDYLNPVVASDPDIYAAIRMGTLVHGPGASDMIYRAWHNEDLNSAVFACLTAICTAYPEAPAKIYRNPGPDQEAIPDRPLKQPLATHNTSRPRE